MRRPVPGPISPVAVPMPRAPPVGEPRRPVRARTRPRLQIPDAQAPFTPRSPPARPRLGRVGPARPESLTVEHGVIAGQPRQTRPRTATASPDGSGAATSKEGGGPLRPPVSARVTAVRGATKRPPGAPLTRPAEAARTRVAVAWRPARPGARDR